MGCCLERTDITSIFPEVDEIGDPTLRSAVIDIWMEVAREMSWERLEDVPQNTRNLSYRNLVRHIRGVTAVALQIAETARAMHGRSYDRDILIAACLLHDASKPLESQPDGEAKHGDVVSGKTSELGRQLPHAVYATHMILQRKLPLALAHLVVTHTHSVNVRGNCWEAAVLFYADYADTDAGVSQAGDTLYSQRWLLEH